jgi:uncharacterized membrane protein YeaQ/YmgE (transglycosylase-associated protein family)
VPLVLIAVALAILVGLWAFIALSITLVGLLLHLFMAGLVGALADAVVPGRLPWGWLGAILAGLVGSWLGVLLIGHRGPVLFGVPIIPGFVGALIMAFVLSAVTKQQIRRL